MSVRQYIGARYVPRFSDVNGGVWSNVYSYEPLTIVKNGNDYYTSKQSVPTGVAITNTDYWVKTGDYNGAIASLDSRLSTAEQEITHITTRKYIFIGDSYNVSGYGNITPTLINYMGLSSDDYINATASGHAFWDSTYLNDLTNAISGKTASELAEYTDIVVIGGINDSYTNITTEVLTNAINSFCEYAALNIPNAIISNIYCGNTMSGIRTTQTYDDRLRAINAYESITKNNYRYLHGCECILHDYTIMSTDGIHPTARGGQIIAGQIKNLLLRGINHFRSNHAFTLESSGDVTVNNPSILTIIDGDITQIRINNFIASNANNWSMEGNQFAPLIISLNLPAHSSCVYGNMAGILSDCTFGILLANGTRMILGGAVAIYQGKLYLYVYNNENVAKTISAIVCPYVTIITPTFAT